MPTISAADLAKLVGGKLVGDGTRVLSSVAPLDLAVQESASFLSNARYFRQLESTAAGVVFVTVGTVRSGGDYIEVADSYTAFVKALEYFNPPAKFEAGIHPSATVANDAVVGKDVYVGPNCVIESQSHIGDGTVLEGNVFVGRKCSIGSGCHLHPQVAIRHECKLGNRVTLHCGVIVGSDGFGFAPEDGTYKKIPQIGNVVIEDDVEIGANTTIDRATMGETRIGQGSKIDNLVQIAHNVKIGRHCVVAAQAGVSGSTQLGDYCRVGGQAGFVGHIKIGNGAAFGAQSGISSDVKDGEILSGSPARPHGLWKRMEVALPRLPELLRRVKRLEEHLGINNPAREEKSER
ncbi:MAG: UDP-3-O-(3-hydroxymyristoyl)glucosamine N-acyltransferase [Calditrichaeota bacterium]|nr:UDP-3-O-(3-hydroxymyristoyl)glucosamine N-acyltransferase [Calditrichota bacterium]MCB9368192.1 UDP-3-O-(3-hydroxymyristoyl)glucosamine N-acyltransferase [Calditrichota bacterium]